MWTLSIDPELAVRERALPTVQRGEALIRVRLAGVCNTDLELVRGYMGFRGVLGHEFVGEVVESEDPSWLGKRVNGEINLGCGACASCSRGLARHCPTRRVLGILNKDGCFAEYLTLPLSNLVEVPAGVSDERAVLTEPLAAAYEVLEQVRVTPGERALVLGDGKLGLLCALVLRSAGAEVTLVGKHRDKLAIAASRGIAIERAGERSDGGYDLVLEATGHPDGLAQAIARTRPRGTLVLKSTFHGATTLELAPVVIHELNLIGSRCGRFAPALAALASGSVDPTPLIHARFPLREGVRAFEHAQRPGVLKVLLEMV